MGGVIVVSALYQLIFPGLRRGLCFSGFLLNGCLRDFFVHERERVMLL